MLGLGDVWVGSLERVQASELQHTALLNCAWKYLRNLCCASPHCHESGLVLFRGLDYWAHLDFVARPVSPIAFGEHSKNMLICAPTGSGKLGRITYKMIYDLCDRCCLGGSDFSLVSPTILQRRFALPSHR